MTRARLLLEASVIACAGTLGSAAVASDFAIDTSRLGKSTVRYRDAARLSEYPAPAVHFRAAGLATGPAEYAEIKERVIYPLIERSPKPIAAIVIQWFPAQPNGLGVMVLWTDGEVRDSTVARSPEGRYDPKAYEILFARPTP